jgi:hypothetical protein
MEKAKKCPNCGSADVQTIYIVSEGYRDWCPQCGKSKISRSVLKAGAVIIGVILIYIIVNICLYYAQETTKRPVIEKCEQLDKKLKENEIIIKDYENRISQKNKDLKARKETIANLEQKLLNPENNYSSKLLFDKDNYKYKQFIIKFNNDVENMNKDISDYKQLIVQYNENVEEYNKLAKDAYTRWFIIPIPGKSKVKK